jgi:hypothetical protein
MAIGLGCFAWFDTRWALAWHIGATLLAMLCGSAGLLNLLRWIGDQAEEHFRGHREALAITPEVMLVKALRNLSPEAIVYLDHRQQSLVLVNEADGSDGMYLRTEYGMVDLDFVKEFFDYEDPMSLRPERFYPEGKKWRDGSELRVLARILTNHAVSMKWAVGARGNQAARWLPGQRLVALHRMRVMKIGGI